MDIFILSIVVFVLFVIVVIINEKNYRPGPPTTVNIPVPPLKSSPISKKFRLDMKMKLNMKSIIRWEQLRKKSFSLMDYTDKEDIDALLYTSMICNNKGKAYTFEVFKQTLTNEKITKEMILTLEREISVFSQFQKKQETSDLSNTEVSPGMIGDLVSALIMSGLDANYALEEMELCDLPMYIEAYERKKKEQMESDRLWTYLTILPHVDGKKLPSPRDFYSFPWEEEEIRKNAEKEIEDNSNRFESFMNTKKSDYYGG